MLKHSLVYSICFILCGLTIQAQSADSLYLQGNFEQAIPILVRQLPVDSSDVNILRKLANAHFQLGDTKSSLTYYLKLLDFDKDDIPTIKRLATIYELEENTPKALKYYLKLTKLLPENGTFFRKVAAQYAKAGESNGAYENYLKAYALNKRDLLTIKSLTEILLARDKVTAADSILWQARAYDSNNIAYALLTARSKYKQKQYDSVIVVMEAIRGRLDFTNYYNKLLGYSYMKEDSIDKAIVCLERSLVDEGNPEKAHYYLSEAYAKKGDETAFVFHLEKAMKSGISNNMAKYHRNMAKHLRCILCR